MKFRKLTHNDAGEEVAPRSPDDGERWDEWVSATKTRGYLLGNTLGTGCTATVRSTGSRGIRRRTNGWISVAST